MKRLSLLLLGGLAVATVAACGGKKPETPAPAQGPNADSAAAANQAREDSARKAQEEADRKARGKAGLARRIRRTSGERASDEYNLAPGNRRATAAKQYLVSHGIDASRIETASYGEERPLDPGHNEEAWAKNRRDESDILAGGN